MTKEELEKKLKIREKTCIHCPTLESAKQVLSIFHHLGLEWCYETSYTICTNWDYYKEDTIYYPFEGKLSSLEFAHRTSYKIINAKEFIALHTEEKEFNLENYTPKWNLIGFPKEIITRMLDYQEEQGNPRDITVFETRVAAEQCNKGFTWDKTKEGYFFWHEVIDNKDFDIFFEKYPKQVYQDNSQEFRVGDEVIDIISGRRGKIHQISTNGISAFPIYVDFNETGSYTLDGRYYTDDKYDKYPRLLHYRDDYDYSVIDFNNLPKRQEPKRWRAEKEGVYYYIRFDAKGRSFTDGIRDVHGYYDNDNYNSGNYFRTEIEAEIIAQKLNTYLKRLIKEEHENEKERN